MAKKLYVYDDVSGVCELASLLGYPDVTEFSAESGVTITPITDPADNSVTYQVAVDACKLPAVTQEDVDNATSVELVACVDGSTGKIPLQDLNTQNTVSSLNNGGVFITPSTNSDGTTNYELSVNLCEVFANADDNGLVIGG